MMKVLHSEQIRYIDAETISKEPILSIDLMERAAKRLFDAICRHFPKETNFVVFAGPGNNGGDAVALYRLLRLEGYKASLYLVNPSERFSPDCQTNIERLESLGMPYTKLMSMNNFPEIATNAVIIDGLFGTGLNRPLESFFAEIIKKINSVPNLKIAIDIPSGMPDDYVADCDFTAIKANLTLSIQFPKPSFFYPENEIFIGKWDLVDIGLLKEAVDNVSSSLYLTEVSDVRSIRKKRSRFAHKGNFGHSLIVAGGMGKYGALILCCKACLRAGAGLVTALCDSNGRISLNATMPEIMTIESIDTVDLKRFTTVAIGPGIGTENERLLLLRSLLENYNKPLVLDADALTLIANNPALWKKIPHDSILTPHIGEFDRLAGKSDNHRMRLQKAITLAGENRVIVVLKGANTAIALPTGEIFFNSTGNPGMATAGSGDVLTGILSGLLSCGYSPREAAIMGVWLHGRAGDSALDEQSEESLVATDIIRKIGKAFKSID